MENLKQGGGGGTDLTVSQTCSVLLGMEEVAALVGVAVSSGYRYLTGVENSKR